MEDRKYTPTDQLFAQTDKLRSKYYEVLEKDGPEAAAAFMFSGLGAGQRAALGNALKANADAIPESLRSVLPEDMRPEPKE